MESKYSKELLESVVKESHSVMDVLRKLDIRSAGGSHAYITKLIKRHGIDTSNFTGRLWNKGMEALNRTPIEEVLVKRDSGNRQKTKKLRNALIKSGRKYVCEECGQLPIWNNKPLVLEIDHINRDFLDDRETNLRFLCLHCHSQTVGFRKRKDGAQSRT